MSVKPALSLGSLAASVVFALLPADASFGAAPPVEPPASAAAGTVANPNIVIGQLNLWYWGAGPWGGFINGSGAPLVKLTPALGHYRSADPKVVRKQIDWAADNGVDVFSIEWIQPGDGVEKNLDKSFLKAANLCRVRWVIFYDFILRLSTSNIAFDSGVDFDDPRVWNLFVGDVARFATRYFKHPQYFTIDGRPVLYVYGTWNFRGDVAGAVREARRRAAAAGLDLYLVGDQATSNRFDADRTRLWDAVTAFVPFLTDGTVPPSYNAAIARTDALYADWRGKIAPLQVDGRSAAVQLQPGFTPQFDNTLFERNQDPAHPGSPIVVTAESQAQVRTMAQTVLGHAQPVGGAGQKIVWLNTWNGWAESTTVEPTKTVGPKYPAGNYQLDMLQVITDVFGRETFGTGQRCPH